MNTVFALLLVCGLTDERWEVRDRCEQQLLTYRFTPHTFEVVRGLQHFPLDRVYSRWCNRFVDHIAADSGHTVYPVFSSLRDVYVWDELMAGDREFLRSKVWEHTEAYYFGSAAYYSPPEAASWPCVFQRKQCRHALVRYLSETGDWKGVSDRLVGVPAGDRERVKKVLGHSLVLRYNTYVSMKEVLCTGSW